MQKLLQTALAALLLCPAGGALAANYPRCSDYLDSAGPQVILGPLNPRISEEEWDSLLAEDGSHPVDDWRTPSLSENGRLTATARGSYLELYDLEKTKLVFRLPIGSKEPIRYVKFLGNQVVQVGDRHYTNRLVRVGDGERPATVLATADRLEHLSYDPRSRLVFRNEGSSIVGRTLPNWREAVRFDFGPDLEHVGEFVYLQEQHVGLLSVQPLRGDSGLQAEGTPLHPYFVTHLRFDLDPATNSHTLRIADGNILGREFPREEISYTRADHGVREFTIPYYDMYELKNTLAQAHANHIYVQPEIDRLVMPYSIGKQLDSRTVVLIYTADGKKLLSSLSFGNPCYNARISPSGRFLAVATGGGQYAQRFDEPYATFRRPSAIIFDLLKPERPPIALEAELAVYELAWSSPNELRIVDNHGLIYRYEIPVD